MSGTVQALFQDINGMEQFFLLLVERLFPQLVLGQMGSDGLQVVDSELVRLGSA